MGNTLSTQPSTVAQPPPPLLSPGSDPTLPLLLIVHDSRTVLVRFPPTFDALTLKAAALFGPGSSFAIETTTASGERVEVEESAYGGLPVGSRVWAVKRVEVGRKRSIEEANEANGDTDAPLAATPTRTTSTAETQTPAKGSSSTPAPLQRQIKPVPLHTPSTNHFSSAPPPPRLQPGTTASPPRGDPNGTKLPLASQDGGLEDGEIEEEEAVDAQANGSEVERAPSVRPTSVVTPALPDDASEDDGGSSHTRHSSRESSTSSTEEVIGTLAIKEHGSIDIWTVQITDSMSLGNLLAELAERTRVPSDDFVLIYGNQELDREQPWKNLSYWGVRSGDLLRLVDVGKIIVSIPVEGKKGEWTYIEAEPDDTIAWLKAELLEHTGISVGENGNAFVDAQGGLSQFLLDDDRQLGDLVRVSSFQVFCAFVAGKLNSHCISKIVPYISEVLVSLDIATPPPPVDATDDATLQNGGDGILNIIKRGERAPKPAPTEQPSWSISNSYKTLFNAGFQAKALP
ncbi:hypothetical protein RQP46_009215 [Phenoliferia psychrophenolica]